MIPTTPPTETVAQMKRLARVLMPYSFPARSTTDEEDITVLKQRDLTVDGSPLLAYHSVTSFDGLELETAQVISKYTTFLPFYVVCKVGVMFLGRDHLNLVELIHY